MASLLKDLNELQAAYAGIEIVTIRKPSTMKIVDGVAVITDNSSTTINITPENVKQITQIVNTLRNKIIN